MVYNLAPAMFVLLVMLWGPLGVIGWVPHSVCSRVAQTKSLGGMRRYPLSRASGRRRLGQGIVQSVTSTSSNTNEPTADTSNMNKNGDVDSSQNFVYKAVFDFANSTAIDQLDRLDDAIMGGISTSAVRAVPGEGFARWSGVCRTDGGYVFMYG